MAIAYDYTTEFTIEFTNKVTGCKAKACDAGTPVTKVLMSYDDAIKCPGLKWDYVFTDDGKFAAVVKATDVNDDGTIKDTATFVDPETDGTTVYVVNAYKKFKNTDRVIPAYRTFNGKKLAAGDSIKFKTSYKDEAVFYQKVAEAYGSTTTDGTTYTGGDVEAKFTASAADEGGEG